MKTAQQQGDSVAGAIIGARLFQILREVENEGFMRKYPMMICLIQTQIAQRYIHGPANILNIYAMRALQRVTISLRSQISFEPLTKRIARIVFLNKSGFNVFAINKPTL